MRQSTDPDHAGPTTYSSLSMSQKKINSLLRKITSPTVRVALESELSHLKSYKKFGLVFENHKPEVLPLWNKKPQRGDYVFIKGELTSNVWRINSIDGDTALLVKSESDNDSEFLENCSALVNQLIVIKRFGDPIYPALTQVDTVTHGSVDNSNPRHSIIEADNYHALQLLRYVYKDKVDCIYIDPPYNTGARDWKYNNDYVDSNDTWRHSKWLSFMQKRLTLAKDLLNPKSSVLIVTIDEHEVHHLACLLDEIFPNSRRQMVTIVNNGAGVSQGGFYRVDEYALFCFIGNATPNAGSDDMLSDENAEPFSPLWFSLIRYGGVNAVPSKRDNLVYPIGINPQTLEIIGTGPSLRDRVNSGEVVKATDDWLPAAGETVNGHPVVWPYRGNGKMATWQMQAETLIDLQKDGFVRVRKHKNGPGGNQYSISYVKSGNRKKVIEGIIPTLGLESSGAKILGTSARKVIAKTVWRRARHDAGKWGSRILRENLGEVAFDYVKSPYAVLDCLSAAVSHKKDALILDFFAGSGTTLLATLLLNERDDGERRCILVTNNEVSTEAASALTAGGSMQGDIEWEARGVCRSVTWPRARNSILGISNSGEKLSGAYIDPHLAEQETAREVINLSFAEGIELDATAKKDLIKILPGLAAGDLTGKDYCVSKDKRTALVFSELDTFVDELENLPDLETIYIATKNKKNFLSLKETILEELGPKIVNVPRTIPMARGFAAGVDYFKLGFLEPGTVSAGQAFSAILPVLWMMAGCHGLCPTQEPADSKWLDAENSRFSVMTHEIYFVEFLENLHANIEDGKALPLFIFLVTDEDDSFIVWRKQILSLPWSGAKSVREHPKVIQLYRNYLDNFRLQVNTNQRGS